MQHQRQRYMGGSNVKDLSRERARLAAAKADIAEMERQQMLGHLVPSASSGRLSSPPHRRVAPAFSASRPRGHAVLSARTPVEAQSIISEPLEEALRELADAVGGGDEESGD